MGFPGDTSAKESAASTADTKDPSSIPGLARSPGEGNGNPLQHSRPENPMDRGAWQGYSPWGCKESDKIALVSSSIEDNICINKGIK